jgi:hypothetical protein
MVLRSNGSVALAILCLLGVGLCVDRLVGQTRDGLASCDGQCRLRRFWQNCVTGECYKTVYADCIFCWGDTKLCTNNDSGGGGCVPNTYYPGNILYTSSTCTAKCTCAEGIGTVEADTITETGTANSWTRNYCQ